MGRPVYLILGLVFLCTNFLGCSGKEPLRELTETEQKLVESSNIFGFELFNEVIAESDGGNVFISPLSISMCLGMTYNGARGSTEEGMRLALEYGDLTSEEINNGYRDLIDLMTGMDPDVTMEIANSVWARENFPFHEEFIDLAEIYFGAEVQNMNFGDPGAADTINDWVSEATQGHIEEIIQAPISALTVMFLINAIYFKAPWTYMFVEDGTEDAPFYTPDGEKTVKMMHQSADLPFLSNGDFMMINLPYGNELYQMTVILPHESTDIDELAAEMNSASFAGWLDQLEVTGVYLEMPRFELEFDSSLVGVLSALGMESSFSQSEADFTGMCVPWGCYLSDVRHSTYVKVNEVGTEATAATIAEVQYFSAAPGFIHMYVNRPFLFAIHDAHTQSLMFMGKIVDPPSE